MDINLLQSMEVIIDMALKKEGMKAYQFASPLIDYIFNSYRAIEKNKINKGKLEMELSNLKSIQSVNEGIKNDKKTGD